jgi:predicted amidohydrolase
MGNENKYFTKGKKRVIFNYKGFRILPVICYDLRFPVWTRNRNDYDLFICAANWPESRREVWNTLLKARAIENQCYVIASAQWGQHNEKISTFGHSLVVDPWGEIIADAGEGEKIIYAELSLEKIEAIRSRLNVLRNPRL